MRYSEWTRWILGAVFSVVLITLVKVKAWPIILLNIAIGFALAYVVVWIITKLRR